MYLQQKIVVNSATVVENKPLAENELCAVSTTSADLKMIKRSYTLKKIFFIASSEESQW